MIYLIIWGVVSLMFFFLWIALHGKLVVDVMLFRDAWDWEDILLGVFMWLYMTPAMVVTVELISACLRP